MKKQQLLTADYVRSLLSYDPKGGLLRWRVTRNNFVQAGQIAGSIGNQGYVVVKIDSISYQAHQIAWLIFYGHWPRQIPDHIDHCESNNSIDNLRNVSVKENFKNRRLRSINTSGVAGVNWHGGKWQARIVANGKRMSLGHYDSLEDAENARNSAKIKYGYHPNHGL
jgi:hypothetical protein